MPLSIRKGSRAAFKVSNKGAKGHSKEAKREQRGSIGEQGGAQREQGESTREHHGAVQGRSRCEPEEAPLAPA